MGIRTRGKDGNELWNISDELVITLLDESELC